MIKLLLLLLTSVYSISAFSTCSDQIWSNYKWAKSPAMNEKIKSCIVNSDLFQDSLNGLLCMNNQESISDEYEVYLDYKSKFEQKIKERDAAISETARRVLNSDIHSIENEWVVFGFKYEIRDQLLVAFSAEEQCFSENQ